LIQAIKMLKYNVIFHKKLRQSTLHMHKKSKKFGDFGRGQKKIFHIKKSDHQNCICTKKKK